MVVEIRWTTEALGDIENIAQFIAKDSEHYAIIQTERFFEKIKILETHPLAGQIVPELKSENVRQLIEGNYRIIYLVVSKSRIDVLTIHHSKRLISNNPLFEE
ncbi:MAG: type II toxin-antitoxin system RelE/ParE family toxin [Bacteroidetes bacterium]|nr:type II toxin-antitoxin system RelE/ParE family toxin [Bacteroidota bacterium]